MNVMRLLHFLSFASIAVFGLLSYTAQADEYNFALVRCNTAAGVVNIQEGATEDDMNFRNAPAGYQLEWLGKLVEYVQPPKGTPDDAVHGTYRRKIGDWRLSCILKGVVYDVVISPWSEEDMVMAPCGPGDPNLELTVFRDKHILVRNLRFGGGCLRDIEPILAIKLSETRQEVTLEKAFVSPTHETRSDIDITYAKMPLFEQSAVLGPKIDPRRFPHALGERSLRHSTPRLSATARGLFGRDSTRNHPCLFCYSSYWIRNRSGWRSGRRGHVRPPQSTAESPAICHTTCQT
jgi:hypothetical protein